jgi:hypothetical protein
MKVIPAFNVEDDAIVRPKADSHFKGVDQGLGTADGQCADRGVADAYRQREVEAGGAMPGKTKETVGPDRAAKNEIAGAAIVFPLAGLGNVVA